MRKERDSTLRDRRNDYRMFRLRLHKTNLGAATDPVCERF
jgi:hypothetical protein